MATTILGYAASHFVIFKAQGPMVFKRTGAPVTFFDYFDMTTRSIHFVDDTIPKPAPAVHYFGKGASAGNDETPKGLGTWGYGVRALELGAFSIAAFCTPLVLQKRPYCELCQRYHKRYRLTVLPASVRLRKRLGLFSPRSVRFDGDHAVAAAEAERAFASIAAAVTAGEAANAGQLLQQYKPGSKAAAKLPRRMEIWLDRCAQCGHGTLTNILVTGIDSRNTSRQQLWAAAVPSSMGDTLKPR